MKTTQPTPKVKITKDGERKCDCDLHRKCIDSRWDMRGYRRRRYACQECAERWTTIECRVHGRAADMRKVLAKELGNVRLIPTRELNIMKDFTKALGRVLPGGQGSLASMLTE